MRYLRHINIRFCFVESRAVIDLPEVNIFKHSSHSFIKLIGFSKNLKQDQLQRIMVVNLHVILSSQPIALKKNTIREHIVLENLFMWTRYDHLLWDKPKALWLVYDQITVCASKHT